MNGRGRHERETLKGNEPFRRREDSHTALRLLGRHALNRHVASTLSAPQRARISAGDAGAREADESEAYEALFQATGDATLIVDFATGRFVRGNAAAVEVLGHDVTQLQSIGMRALFPAGHQEALTSLLSELCSSGAVERSELCLQRRDGSVFRADLRLRTYVSGAQRRYVVVIRDVTERVERTRELKQARIELEAAHAHTLHNDKLIALGQLAAGVAHEVNNPASFVLMNLDEIADILERAQSAGKALRTSLLAWLDGEQRERAEECLAGFPIHRIFREGSELIGECVDGVQRITSLVRDLRGFARIDENEVSLVTMNDVVITACKMVQGPLRRQGHLRTRLESRRQIAADRRRLVQVVTNLLMNAGQALEEAPSDEPLIEVTTFDTDDAVVLRVRDTGPGIQPALLDKIFEPFFSTKRERGTGLGLSVCADIVRQHSGRVSVTSAPGAGATFEVRLPFDSGLHIARTESPHEVQVTSSSAARVLVIDDEPHLLRAYRRLLSRHHSVTVALGGAAALALLERNSEFDAVLCDLTMPEVDGVRIYRALERVAPHLRPRMIFSSGGAFTRRAEDLLSSIDNPCLEKPVDLQKLLAAIEVARSAPGTPTHEAQRPCLPQPSGTTMKK